MGAPRKDKERGRNYSTACARARRRLSREYRYEYCALLQAWFDKEPDIKLSTAQNRVYWDVVSMHRGRYVELKNEELAKFEPWKSAVAQNGMPKVGTIQVPKPDFDGLALVNKRKDRRAKGAEVRSGREARSG